MKTAALVANGTIRDYTRIRPLIAQHDSIIAVDGGLNHLHAMNLEPALIIGDLDSASRELLAHYASIPKKNYPTEKDDTDLELALKEVYTPDLEKVTLFGALGQRADHALANIHLLRRYPGVISIVSDREEVFAVKGMQTISCFPGQTVSLLPVGICEGVTTKGLKWELENATLDKAFFSISNICLAETFSIKIERGDVICFKVTQKYQNHL